MIGVILAAGDGSRLKNSTNEAICKPLITINNKKLITYSLDNLVHLQADEAYIVVGKESNLIKETLGNEYKQLKLHYVYQAEQKGLINAFVQALYNIPCNETVILQLADEVFIGLRADLIKSTIKKAMFDFYCGTTTEDNFDRIRNNYSVDITEDCVIKKCTEKPVTKINNIKGTGFCVFSSKTVQLLLNKYDPVTNTPCDLCDFMNWLIGENNKGLALCIAEKEFNINTSADLDDVNNFFSAQ